MFDFIFFHSNILYSPPFLLNYVLFVIWISLFFVFLYEYYQYFDMVAVGYHWIRNKTKWQDRKLLLREKRIWKFLTNKSWKLPKCFISVNVNWILLSLGVCLFPIHQMNFLFLSILNYYRHCLWTCFIDFFLLNFFCFCNKLFLFFCQKLQFVSNGIFSFRMQWIEKCLK